jgi:micrococcal nuclease
MNKFSRFGVPIIISIIIISILSFLIYLPFKNSRSLNLFSRLKSEKILREQNNDTETYPVIKIVDGDTIDVLIENQEVRIRLLGINSPESVDPRRPVECFGKEASLYLKKLLENQVVTLVSDKNKPDQDEFGRLLRYVYRSDGLFINEAMIKNGYAYEYTYHDERYQFQNDFKNLEKSAQYSGSGLWGKDTCLGKK